MEDKYREDLNNISQNMGEGPQEAPGVSNQFHSSLKTIHTYADDMARAVKDKQGSVLKIAMAEEEKRREEYENFNPSSKRNVAYIVATFFVLVVTVGLVVFILAKNNQEAKIPDNYEAPSRFNILLADEVKDIYVPSLQKDQVYGLIESVFQEEGSVRGALTLYPIVYEQTDIQASSVEFLESINSEVSAQFKRVLSPIFDVGVYHEDAPERFFLFATTNFDTSFSAMLKWEATMYQEFAPFFGLPTKDAQGNSLGNPIFGDRLIANRDARIVIDREGNIIFLYSLLDQAHILITDNPETMQTVVERLNYR
ncbi:hypothetical protein H6790_00380 [Candidatus Nomurabacteria bacterium]|nr:hypothetical protein [Candidatus Nomurabacteria bacterium]MCB9820392.1 hypothetical protein [Candidatus Nomurabacteria bacterium]